jgi:cation diffusion facilitator family transporter
MALQADGHHVMTDVVTSVGVVVGLALVWLTGWKPLDPLVAIGVALNILRTGWALLRGAVGGLMDEADETFLEAAIRALEAERPDWMIDVHSLRAWRSGSIHHTDLHLCVPRYYDADRLHAIDDGIADAVLVATRRPGDVIVHFDPCRPHQCPGCAMPDCPVRAARFVQRAPLTLEHAVREDEPPDPAPGTLLA